MADEDDRVLAVKGFQASDRRVHEGILGWGADIDLKPTAVGIVMEGMEIPRTFGRRETGGHPCTEAAGVAIQLVLQSRDEGDTGRFQMAGLRQSRSDRA